jgi:hypothetical protein
MKASVGVAWYRTRCQFGQRRGGYLVIVVLLALIGGLAMGSIAAARRTDTSFPRYLASSNASDLSVTAGGEGNNATTAYSPVLMQRIAHLPDVRHVEVSAFLLVAPLEPNGAPNLKAIDSIAPIASISGLLFNQDRVAVIAGRLANPAKADELMVDPNTARLLGIHVGQTMVVGGYSGDQTLNPGFGTPRVPPVVQVKAKVVGIVDLADQVVQDDVDRSTDFLILTPAFGRRALNIVGGETYGVQLKRGASDVTNFEHEFAGLLPAGSFFQFHVTSSVESKVQRAIKPEAIALLIFGVIAILAALLIGLQAVSRQLRARDDELQILRALGASPLSLILDGFGGVFIAIVLGALAAIGVAIALSPLAPIGPVRSVDPSPGVSVDWTVLGLGFVVLVGILGVGALGVAYVTAPHRDLLRESPRPSRLVGLAASSGLAIPVVVGIHFALDRGRGRTAVPVRSVLLGAILAVALVTATLTFGSGLHTLITHPPLYGWNWSYALDSTSDVPPQSVSLISRDPAVASSTGVSFIELRIDGANVPALADSRLSPTLSPPILAGRTIEHKGEIVLGAATAAELHTRLGGTVSISYGTRSDFPAYIPPTKLRVVGLGTLPAVGYPSFIQDHPSMGTGAFLSRLNAPASFLRATEQQADPVENGPNIVFVRLKPTVSARAGFDNVRHLASAANQVLAHDPNELGNDVSVLGVQHPAEIVNYRSIGATPALLASGLALGAVVALGLALVASVRRRRRDLALLKTLGFTKNGLAFTLVCQASVIACIAAAVGLPLGIAFGRELWTLFAESINAVPEPSVPVFWVAVVGVGALVFANVVAALPGRLAARTPAAAVLRAE